MHSKAPANLPADGGKNDDSSNKALMTQQRRERIAEHVQKHGVARVGELTAIFGVSGVTIRSDLVHLEKYGRLVRDRGGALAKNSGVFVTNLARVDERATQHLDAKQRIAKTAAQLISPGDTIILDAGTTVMELAKLLKSVSPLTVVTNAINVALEFVNAPPDTRLVLLGGTYSRESASTLGSLAQQNLQELAVQRLFLGTQAIDLAHGLSDSTMEIAQIKRAMIAAAREVILLTDSSKWGLTSLTRVAPLNEIDMMITDRDLPTSARPALEKLGIELHIV